MSVIETSLRAQVEQLREDLEKQSAETTRLRMLYEGSAEERDNLADEARSLKAEIERLRVAVDAKGKGGAA